MATPRSAWGIDIGNRALKAVKLTRNGDDLRIEDFDVIEHEHILSDAGDNRDSLVQAALANFVQRHAVKGSAVAVGVSGQSSFARFIKLPPVEPKKIPEIVRFEAIQQIPFPLDDVEWSYQLFQDPQSPEVEVGIFAMRKELVQHHIDVFSGVGMDVELVQMNPLAVYNAMYRDQRVKGTTMIIDLGAETTDLIIAEGETIWLRSIPIGGNNFTEALVKSFKLKFSKAEELKRNAASSKYGRQILQAMRPVFADLVAEVQRSIGFYASVHRDSRISQVVVLGGTFRLPGLQKYLQQNLQLEVNRIDTLGAGAPGDARFASLFNENILSAVSAYGLAVQAMGQGKINSSLLPEHIRREKMWKRKTKWFAAAAALFLVGTGVAVSSAFLNQFADQQDHLQFGPQLEATTAKARNLDQKWKAIQDLSGPDVTQIADLQAMVTGREVWANLTKDIAAAFPPPPKQDVKQIMAIPRGQRTEVKLDYWKAQYIGDLEPVLAYKDSEFNALADKANGNGSSSGSFRPSNPMPGGGFPEPGAPPGMPMPPGVRPNMPAPAAAASGTGSKKRGFILTIRCTTPNSAGSTLVSRTVLAALKARNQASPNPPQGYSIERVTIPSDKRLGLESPGGVNVQRARTPFSPAATPGFTPMAPGMPGTFGPPMPGAFGPSPGGAPFMPPGMPAPTDKPAVDPFADPVTGEDMKNDSVVTVLVAVLLDPPPKQVAAANP